MNESIHSRLCIFACSHERLCYVDILDYYEANEDALEFEEFLEAISVIALHQNADPYLPIATRIEEYLMDLVAKNTKIF